MKNKIRLIKRECVWCGEKFLSRSNHAKYCTECKDGRDDYGNFPAGRRKNPNKELFSFVKRVDEYNALHNTHLSYGEFVLNGLNNSF